MRFEWDRINQSKHGGLRFQGAALVFSDLLSIFRRDRGVAGEQRWNAIGLATGAVLLVVHVYRLENGLRDGQRIEEVFTHCFVPRVSHSVGALDVHDVGMNREGDVVFVNTRGNCLATVSSSQQVRPIWAPFFISEITCSPMDLTCVSEVPLAMTK